MTLADLAQEWLQHLQDRTTHRDPKQRRSVRTVGLYRQRVEQHIVPALGHLAAGEVNLGDVRRLIDLVSAKGLAPGTVASVVNILSGLLRYGIRVGVVERNPVQRPRPRGPAERSAGDANPGT